MPKLKLPKFKMPKFKVPSLGRAVPAYHKPRATWTKQEVKTWFKQRNGLFFKFYPCFAGLDGKEMCALSYDDFLKRCETAGEALYYVWNDIVPRCECATKPVCWSAFGTAETSQQHMDGFPSQGGSPSQEEEVDREARATSNLYELCF